MRSEPAAVVYVGVAEKTEVTSPQLIWTELKLGWDVTDDVTDEDAGAAMLTNPVNRLRRGSAHKPPPPPEAAGSKVKRPL